MDHRPPAVHHFRRDGQNQGNGSAYLVDIGGFKADAPAGALAARLAGGVAAEHQHQILPDGAEGGPQRQVKAVAIGIENDEACHAPSQTDGGEDAALPVELQRLRGFVNEGG